MSEFREQVKAAIDAALRGDNLREYQQVLIRLAVSSMAVEKNPNYQDYLSECRKIFERVGEVDLSESMKKLSARELIEHIGRFVQRLLYLEPPAEGLSPLPMIAGTPWRDNRLLLLTGFLIACPESPYQRVIEVAVNVVSKRACGIELQKRFIKMKSYVRHLLSLIYAEDHMKSSDLAQLFDEIRPIDWPNLADQHRTPTDDKKREVDSLLGFNIGLEAAKQARRPIPEVMLDALEKRFDYLPKRMRDRIISEIRKAKSQKRRPPGGIESWDATEEKAEQPPLSELARSKIEDALRRSKSELEKAYGPKALEFIKSAMLTAGPPPTQEEMAKKLGISSRQVRKYILKMKVDPKPLFRFLAGRKECLD